MQMEALLEVLEPLLSIFASTDVVFSPKAGYTVLCVTPYTSEVLESKSINEPKEMAAYLLDSIKYDYCFSLGVNTLLSTDSFCSLEELEYAMPHYQKAVYSAVFKEVQDKISSILAQPPLRTPRFSLQEDPLLTVLYNFQRSLSLQQRLFLFLIKNLSKLQKSIARSILPKVWCCVSWKISCRWHRENDLHKV